MRSNTPSIVLSLCAVLQLAQALPSSLRLVRRDATAQLISIAPTSNTCDGAPFASECVTASQAVEPLVSSFNQYGITTAGEQAALLSWMAFESGDFKYNKNHYPGTPGQGTRCMLSPTFVKQYVSSIPALSNKTASATDPAAVLQLVEPDEFSFGSAAWFLSTQCSQDVRSRLQAGTAAGWEAFVTGCVQTTVTDARKAYWTRATAALGV